MGKTGMFMKNVFSRSRSIQKHKSHSVGTSKRKWGVSVRSYLCGDEHESTLVTEYLASVKSSIVEETNLSSFRSNGANVSSTINELREFDSASVMSSEATVTQPLQYGNSLDHEENKRMEKPNSTYKLFRIEDAALIIQSAFKSYLAKREKKLANEQDEMYDSATMASPSKESITTSIEVQTGNSSSSDIFSIDEENLEARSSTMQLKTRTQVLKLQEDWDASTVSSVISKMRIQNKLEAATRRERALAYAFSQQLRICSKKKQRLANGEETNTGWNWLERWMATREPETAHSKISDGYRKTIQRKRMFDISSTDQEKESCGSNEVLSFFEVKNHNFVCVPKNVPPRPPKYRSGKMMTRNCSRQGSVAHNMCPKKTKVLRKTCNFEEEKETS